MIEANIFRIRIGMFNNIVGRIAQPNRGKKLKRSQGFRNQKHLMMYLSTLLAVVLILLISSVQLENSTPKFRQRAEFRQKVIQIQSQGRIQTEGAQIQTQGISSVQLQFQQLNSDIRQNSDRRLSKFSHKAEK